MLHTLDTVHSRIGRIRLSICLRCPHQCEQFKSKKINHDDTQESCPTVWSGRWFPIEIAPDQNNFSPFKTFIGAASWKELHTFIPSPNIEDNQKWIDNFNKRVPNFGCGCQNNWKKWILQNPIDWNNYFTWTVKAHNEVNARLNKPILSLEEALKIWKG